MPMISRKYLPSNASARIARVPVACKTFPADPATRPPSWGGIAGCPDQGLPLSRPDGPATTSAQPRESGEKRQ